MKNSFNKKYIIETGIGLQDVDRLKNSTYFLNETNRYIKGEISLEELDTIISSYYESKPCYGDRVEEADKISIRIAKIISEDSFTFTVGQLLAIHRTLFDGILENPGELRKYNFSKEEWVLDGDTVTYGDYRELEMTLQYDFEREKKFNYKNLSINEIIEHLAIFIANLWQIHVFEEGNTRTTAVFFIKYLRSLGFDVTNDTFAKNSWYFRNSLVRANYNNIIKGVFEDRTYLIKFLKNLLLGEHNDLQNRNLHISSIQTKSNNTSRESRVLEIIRNDPHITSEQLSKQINVSVRTIKSLLKVLKSSGKIKRINGKRYGYWKVI
ncbi:MAG: Fic family protein [Bacilli bacterium]|nr:Fic family protein [Bacilli bacterium]